MTDTDLIRTSQLLTPGDLVTLYTFDLTNFNAGILRYTPDTSSGSAIVYDGNTYLPLMIETSGFKWSGQGSLPRPKIIISNVQNTPGALAITYQELTGATIIRTRTFAQFLDDGIDPDPFAKFPDDVFQVNRKTRHDKNSIEWELATAIDQQGRKLPGRQALRDTCTHIYRRYDADTSDFDYSKATCPYVASNYFDKDGASVAIDADICGKLLSSCRLRFGENGILPTRAMPGISRFRR